MTIIELANAFADAAPVGIVITDARLNLPGPSILYANDAFGRLTGRNVDDVVGQSPRFMQGRQTRIPTLNAFRSALAKGERFHGYLTNYRGDGSKYLVEIDCRPISRADGTVEHFISFEREVVRRVGRPALGTSGRYEPLTVSNDLLKSALPSFRLFV